MKKREEIQFFDGLLLGGLITGLVIAVVMIFFLFQDADQVGEGEYVSTFESVVSLPAETSLVERKEDIGKNVAQNGTVYIIQSSFSNQELDLTYRSLVSPDKTTHASLWSKNGEQLLYKANNDIFTMSGSEDIELLDIIEQESLLLKTTTQEELIYNLRTGMVIPATL